ncbi:MSCRAMM family protein [Floccifex sp.]|uniref:MSCRAMM family protein n=1 Tax=Floccifex sp. TaxID=2815810 RepID=UPI003EFEE6EB
MKSIIKIFLSFLLTIPSYSLTIQSENDFSIFQVARYQEEYIILDEFKDIINTNNDKEEMIEACIQKHTQDISYVPGMTLEKGIYIVYGQDIESMWIELNQDLVVYPKTKIKNATLILHKVDESNNTIVLPCEFILQDQEVSIDIQRTKNGFVQFEIPVGSYIIHESKAPFGYIKNYQDIHVSWDGDQLKVNGKEVESDYELEFINHRYINTGIQTNFVLFGLCMMGTCLFIYLKTRYNKNRW